MTSTFIPYLWDAKKKPLHDKPVSSLVVDLKRFYDIMSNENSQPLSHSSRVKTLAVILEIDIKGDISDNMADFIHRKNAYVANKYQ